MVAGSAGQTAWWPSWRPISRTSPVALMTGVPPHRRAALGVTHDRVVEKPFELETLLDTVRRMLAPHDRMKIFPGTGCRSRRRRRATAPLAVAIGNFDGVHLGHQALLDEAREARGAQRGASVGRADVRASPCPAVRAGPGAAAHCLAGATPGAVGDGGRRRGGRRAVHARVRRHRGGRLRARGAGPGSRRARRGRRLRLQLRPGARGRRRAAGGAGAPSSASASRSFRRSTVDGVPCSSTKVREFVPPRARRASAARLLGPALRARRRVSRGAGRGRAARLSDRQRRPRSRAACRARASTPAAPPPGRPRRRGGEACRGAERRAATRPSPRRPAAVTVEAYLLDFDGDLYDRRLRLEIGDRLRDEQRFDSDRGAGGADRARRRPSPRDMVAPDVRHRDHGRAVREAGPARRGDRRSTAGWPKCAETPAPGARYQARIAELAQDPRPRPASRRPGLRVPDEGRAPSTIEWRLPPETPRRRCRSLLLRREPDGIETEPALAAAGGAARPNRSCDARALHSCARPLAAWSAMRFVPLVRFRRSDRLTRAIRPRGRVL